GGIWNLYTLNNGGAFMAPEPDDDDDETWVLFNAMTVHYYRLRDYALQHPECSAIMRIID
ncbi:antirestriction protein, partial [Escherichia coli]|nr:antirestriction protein [Escherichia coli]